ncbi:hypothetical protein EXU57_00935 [Segetibacter sp. 3557_3]|uniref:bestrophin family protein n=1 Tax=Segetibacter sp. 3557_3 TaxID=2547429 RepID=UPI001058CEA3|nr:bestrophin family protein [Segetibacter sp. 3557_3]TDH28674.1 hypothetical protein EXU57_00935 [Segetibacter sp. 3557_3]
MIIYQSNRNWLRDIRHLFTSFTMQKVVKSTLLVMLLTGVIAWVQSDMINLGRRGLDVTVFSLLGVVLSILLSFRTNTAYDRWWEGRKLWGELVNNCRNMAAYLHSTLPDEDLSSRRFIAFRLSNFCIVLKGHLRNSIEMKELLSVSEEDIRVYSTKSHLPSFIAYEIMHHIQGFLKAGEIRGEDLINLHEHSKALLNIAGACERIRKTPIPFSYNVYLKLFITVYALCLPFALIPMFHYWSVLLVGFVFFAFIGLELMAEEIEDPFGLDCNDLPIAEIANNIKKNIFEIFELRQPEQEPANPLYTKVF